MRLAGGRRPACPITQIFDETQEADLAEWWRDHPGLYDKSNDMYRMKEKEDRLIAEKARGMGVPGFDGKQRK